MKLNYLYRISLVLFFLFLFGHFLIKAKTEQSVETDLQRSQRLKYQKGLDFLNRDNNFTAAMKEFQEFLELYPGSDREIEVYRQLLQIFHIKKKYRKYLLYSSRFLSLYPDKREAVSSLLESCRIYYLQGNLDKSKNCYDSFLNNYRSFKDLFRQASTEVNLRWPKVESGDVDQPEQDSSKSIPSESNREEKKDDK